MIFDTRALFDGYQSGLGSVDQGVRALKVDLTSDAGALLEDEDRAVVENARFKAALLLPESGGPWNELVVLFHGLNEGTETKLFPWAANLAARGHPALVFPSAFHLSRRPQAFLEARGEAFAQRRGVAGNTRSSPYNAVLSKRFAQKPERFLRGTMQSYRDVTALARALREGTHPTLSQHFAKDAHLSFLGYSIGGYLAKLAMMLDPDGLFGASRAVLFCTGAALYHVRPQTILILDVDAKDRLYAHYDTDAGRAGTHALLDGVQATDDEKRVLSAMLHAGPAMKDGLRALGKRVAGVANTTDEVFPLVHVAPSFEGLSLETMELGLHELPFNQRGPLSDVYSDKEGRRLLVAVVKATVVGEDLRAPFARFAEICGDHFSGR